MGSIKIGVSCPQCNKMYNVLKGACPNCGHIIRVEDMPDEAEIKWKIHGKGVMQYRWSAEEYAILFAILTFFTAAFYGIVTVVTVVSLGVVAKVLVCVWPIAVIVGLPLLKLWLLKVVRWVERKFTPRDTFDIQ